MPRHNPKPPLEVRIREKVGENRWVKKSKFYNTRGSKEAVSHYEGEGSVMWSKKRSKEKFWGIGEFFKLGDELLKDFAKERRAESDTLLDEVMKEKERVRNKRYFSKLKKGVTDGTN